MGETGQRRSADATDGSATSEPEGHEPTRAAVPEGAVTRFAPSPTGRMHAGNVYASLVAYILARRAGGSVVLRIEDLDPERCKPHFSDQVMHDYELLGLHWDRGPYYQADRADAYQAAYERIAAQARVYPCFCTRASLHAASAPHWGEKPVYPGTCRDLSPEQRSAREREARAQGRAPSWRLAVPAKSIAFDDLLQGTYEQRLDTECGDFLIRRSDGAFAYQLAVVVDDAEQGVNLVVRGIDLLCSTPQQIHLQRLLGSPQPTYAHVPLLVSQRDRRLSKRDRDASLDELLARFGSPERVLGHIAFACGLVSEDGAYAADELVRCADLDALAGLVQVPWT